MLWATTATWVTAIPRAWSASRTRRTSSRIIPPRPSNASADRAA